MLRRNEAALQTVREVARRKTRLRRVRHIVRHLHRRPGVFSIDECSIELPARIRRVPTIGSVRSSRHSSKLKADEGDLRPDAILERVAAQIRALRPISPRGTVVSTIETGAVSAVYYGHDSPAIRHQVDRLVRQIARGKCLPGGPLAYDGALRSLVRSRRRTASYAQKTTLLGELFFEISTDKVGSEKDRTLFGEWFKREPDDPRTWTRTPAPSAENRSLWEIYRHAPPVVVEAEFLDRCRSLRLLKGRSDHHDQRAMDRLAALREVLRERRTIRKGKTAPAHETAIDLAAEIARVLLDCHPKTLRRLVHSVTPSVIYLR